MGLLGKVIPPDPLSKLFWSTPPGSLTGKEKPDGGVGGRAATYRAPLLKIIHKELRPPAHPPRLRAAEPKKVSEGRRDGGSRGEGEK